MKGTPADSPRQVQRHDLFLCEGDSGRCHADLKPHDGGDWVEYDVIKDQLSRAVVGTRLLQEMMEHFAGHAVMYFGSYSLPDGFHQCAICYQRDAPREGVVHTDACLIKRVEDFLTNN